MSAYGITRRDLFRKGGLLGGVLTFPGLLRGGEATATAAPAPPAATGLRVGPDIYQSIGVRPLVNARGTYTILSGSTMLPEVRDAMAAAAQHYVHLDELAEAVGARLAELTKAEWGLVTVGCAAALTHATAACVAGGNPDLHVRIPNLDGFARDEVIIPKHSRNVYDAALRAVGVRVIEVTTPAELEAALGPRTALVYILAGPEADESPLNTKVIASMAQARNVPVLVDAAAEILTVPNVHLQNGATLVAYSGGKCLRGPQAAGLLLGRKDLVKAAWVHSAPHHGYARSMKVGKEEAIGMLMAVEMWMKRDHEAEWKRWTSWLENVAKRVSTIDGVTTAIVQPRGLSNRMPSLRVYWDRKRFGLGGETVVKTLFDTDPRVGVFPARSETDPTLTGVTVNPYMMAPGDEKIVADRLHAILSSAPRKPEADPPAVAAADLSGTWDARIEYAAGASNHTLNLRQRGSEIDGEHRGDFVARDLMGALNGDDVSIRSFFGESHGDSISYTFTGKVSGDEMGGTLDMGEYLGARWTAKRRGPRRG
jgi:L-seryl-tRNA(Ser) seleniumtransferase